MTNWTARDILDSIEEGKLRLAMAKEEAEAAAQQRLDEETAWNEAAWAPIIARIKQSIPEWAWQYLTHPNREPTFHNDHCLMVVPATIDLQGMGQVFVYYYKDSHPLFMPAEWRLSDDEEAWSVCPFNGRSETKYSLPGNPDFLIALAQAHANMEHYAEMKAEADRRNVELQERQVKQPPTVQKIDWLELAVRSAQPAVPVRGNENWTIAYVLVGILEQLRMITIPLYGRTQHAIQTFDNSRSQF